MQHTTSQVFPYLYVLYEEDLPGEPITGWCLCTCSLFPTCPTPLSTPLSDTQHTPTCVVCLQHSTQPLPRVPPLHQIHLNNHLNRTHHLNNHLNSHRVHNGSVCLVCSSCGQRICMAIIRISKRLSRSCCACCGFGVKLLVYDGKIPTC